MIKSVLVAVDSSSFARAALEQAITLSKAYEARLTGLNVLDIRYVEMPPYLDYSYSLEAVPPVLAPLDLMDRFQEKGERILSELRKTVEAAGVSVETRIEQGVPGQAVADLAREHDLVVLGKRGEHAKWGRDLLGSTAEAVSKRSTVPVLLTDEEARPFGSALVMFDDSEPADRALRLAADLATRTAMSLVVLNAQDDTEEGERMLDVARAYLQPLQVSCTYLALPGKPAEAAASALADHPADVAVIGTRGHSVIHDLIIGRTAEQLMRTAQIPVLLVP